MPAYESRAPIDASIDVNASGHVEVVASDRTDTTVEVTPTNPGRSGDVSLARQATVAFENNHLRVHVPGRLRCSGRAATPSTCASSCRPDRGPRSRPPSDRYACTANSGPPALSPSTAT